MAYSEIVRAARYPGWARHWRFRSRTLDFGTTPKFMGIVNVTPDSFSDGGKFYDAQQAIDRGLQLVEDGADILDIGGESTRPYSEPVTVEEELRRVIPVLEGLRARADIPFSIDTSKSQVAREAIAAGVEIVNDVTGLAGDFRMVSLCAETGVGVVAMHMQGTPRTMQDNPQYGNIVREIHQYFAARLESLLAAGIERDRICLDPGIGFGKTHEHNLTLMAACHSFHDLGCPLLVGHSRKGFLGKLLGDKEADREMATSGASVALAVQGIQIVRVHQVKATREAIIAFAACGGFDQR